jgi:hypothetical protein
VRLAGFILKIKIYETMETSPAIGPVNVEPMPNVSETLSTITEIGVMSNSNDAEEKYPECGILISFLHG